MTEANPALHVASHSHVFLGQDHERAERRTWIVIALCSAMMIAEIAGGALFGSLALVADGLHMSTHAGALLLAAMAYAYARKYADDRTFTFGTGKFGDLAGYSSAIVLAMIALLIAYEAIGRLFAPVPIRFGEAIPIACLGLAVNVASAWLLRRDDHHHHHSDGPGLASAHGHRDGHRHEHRHVHRHDDHGGHDHHRTAAADRDNNMRAALVHVAADAAVSVLVILGLVAARTFDWMWMDPLAGLVGAGVIASWSYGLVRDTGAILLDVNPDTEITRKLRATVEGEGDELTDLHLWRLGPGHLGAILSIATGRGHDAGYYHAKLARFPSLSHVTVELSDKA